MRAFQGAGNLGARAAAAAPGLPVWPPAAETKARSRPTFASPTQTLCACGEMAPPTDFKLHAHPKIKKPEGPVLVCIVDGWVSDRREESLGRRTRRRARPRPKPPRRRRRRRPPAARRSGLQISPSKRHHHPPNLLHTTSNLTDLDSPYKPSYNCNPQGENVSKDEWNAVHAAATPAADALRASAPAGWRTLAAHGTAVGLPTDDDMGNSEVGHNALGEREKEGGGREGTARSVPTTPLLSFPLQARARSSTRARASSTSRWRRVPSSRATAGTTSPNPFRPAPCTLSASSPTAACTRAPTSCTP